MIALITPTGAREAQLRLCAKFMQRQTYAGEVCWVVVDDALPRSSDFIVRAFRQGWDVIKVYPQPVWEEGQNTQGRNLKAGIAALLDAYHPSQIEAIFIIEDDDYYRPVYLQAMYDRMNGCDIWGETHTIYYNVNLLRWIENQNAGWSSLFQTAFKPAALTLFEMLYGQKFIDYEFFRLSSSVNLFRTEEKLSIGIKGQAGRKGIGAGHGYGYKMLYDINGQKLRELIGNDADLYI
jgi:hypothetical protein